jgi:hypothetical protein
MGFECQVTKQEYTHVHNIWYLLFIHVRGKGKGKVHPVTGHEGPEVE